MAIPRGPELFTPTSYIPADVQFISPNYFFIDTSPTGPLRQVNAGDYIITAPSGFSRYALSPARFASVMQNTVSETGGNSSAPSASESLSAKTTNVTLRRYLIASGNKLTLAAGCIKRIL